MGRALSTPIPASDWIRRRPGERIEVPCHSSRPRRERTPFSSPGSNLPVDRRRASPYAGPMSVEIEIKFRVADHEDLVRRLGERGGVPGPEIDQEDLYLAHPARDFGRTDEAFRLRRDGDANRITY